MHNPIGWINVSREYGEGNWIEQRAEIERREDGRLVCKRKNGDTEAGNVTLHEEVIEAAPLTRDNAHATEVVCQLYGFKGHWALQLAGEAKPDHAAPEYGPAE